MSNPTYGTKVTDPKAPSIHESSGPVASDSLAAESSSFKTSNSATPLGVAGANSTFANSDTSGATKLDPISSAASRTTEETYTTQSQAHAGSNAGGITSSAGVAPTYVNAQNAGRVEKPKGGEEGDFSSGLKNASFGTDIGSRNDPGRLAEQKFATDASKSGSGLAGLPTQKGGLGENSYEELERNAEA